MKNFILLAKLLCTGLLLYFVFKGIDFSQTKAILYSKKGLIVITCATIIMVVQTIIAGFRTMLAMRILNLNIDLSFAIMSGFIANFFSQVLISFVGGDAMRLLSLVRHGKPYGDSARAIFLDRVLGFISLQILYFIGIYYLLELIDGGMLRFGILSLALISFLMIILFFLLGMLPHKFYKIKYMGKIFDLVAISRYLYNAKILSMCLLLLSCLVHFCNILAIFVIAKILNVELSFFNAFLVGIPVMYISMLPFSVGGWGLRENTMIIGLALLGITSELSLTISIIIGLGLLISSLPGALIFWDKILLTNNKKNDKGNILTNV